MPARVTPKTAAWPSFCARTIEGNAHFAQLWRAGAVSEHAQERKTVEHPTVGDITVDYDVLSAGDTDL